MGPWIGPLAHPLAMTMPASRPVSAAVASDDLLAAVPPQAVQSIRAFRIPDLQQAAVASGQHFLYAHLATAQTRAEVLEQVGRQFHFPPHYGRNFDALYDCLTDSLHDAGQQPGFVVVLDQVPATAKFDKEMREQFIDCFRDAADFWGERGIAFRCFYSYL